MNSLEALVEKVAANPGFTSFSSLLREVRKSPELFSGLSEREAVLAVCKVAIQRGLTAGSFHASPEDEKTPGAKSPEVGSFLDLRPGTAMTFVAWDKPIDDVLTLIATRWDALLHDPEEGEVVWLSKGPHSTGGTEMARFLNDLTSDGAQAIVRAQQESDAIGKPYLTAATLLIGSLSVCKDLEPAGWLSHLDLDRLRNSMVRESGQSDVVAIQHTIKSALEVSKQRGGQIDLMDLIWAAAASPDPGPREALEEQGITLEQIKERLD